MNALKRFLNDEHGLETVEWVVMGCLIILGVAALAGVLLSDLNTGVGAISDEVETAVEIGTGGGT
jgi:Flp pilus assembly pilin Flp